MFMRKQLIYLICVVSIAGCVHLPTKPASKYTGNNIPVVQDCSDAGQCAETYFMMYGLRLSNGDVNGAIEDIKKSLSYDPSSAYLHLILAKLYDQQQQYEVAIKEVDQALKIDPGYVPALYAKADIYSNSGKTQQAIDILKQIVKLSPDSEDAYIALALTQYHANETKDAQDTLKDMILHVPSSPYSYYYLAKIAVDQKKYREAIEYYNNAIKASPDFYTALYEQADVYAYIKEYDKAIGVYKGILKDNPEEYGLYEKVGDLYLTAKKYMDALDSYKKAESLIPSLVLQLKIGMVYVELKQYEPAEATFKAIIAYNPSFYRAYYYYGILLSENKKDDQAIEILNKVPPDNEIYPDAVVQIAVIYSNRKNNKQAEDILLPVLEKTPAVDTYNLYASFFAQDKDYKQAIDVLNKALNKFTDSQAIMYHLGAIYDQSGDTDDEIGRAHV